MFASLKTTAWTFVHKVLLLITMYMLFSLRVPLVVDDISQYTLDETLGEGAFGKVVNCKKNGQVYAMKIQEKKDNEFLEDEVRVLRTINGNEACVQMISTFEDDTRHYIVFEKLYKSVYEVILERTLTDNEIISITRQTLEALVFLNSKNLIHGDIKPENILFVNSGDPRIKLIDFGLATFDDATDKTNTISTTPYRCPESLFNLIWSFGADIWSLGCLMCEMKTGDLFFYSGDHCEEFPNDDAKQRHLSEIEKVCGPFTKQMVRKCSKFFTENGRCGSSFMSKESKEILKKQMVIHEVFSDNAEVASLVKKMLTIDPHRRISAAGALRYNFFVNK
jgi:serine/threonine protein kinase